MLLGEEARMKAAQTSQSLKILVIDVGGTHIKLLATGQRVPRKIPSGPTITASKMVRLVKKAAADWEFDCISMGYPGPVINDTSSASHITSPAAGWDSTFERRLGAP